jgi:arylsulfatase A-like enzyme
MMGEGRPNVLVLATDQQRADTLGCYGGFGAQVCRTPNLDRLAVGGVLFRNAYTAVPLCSPARASLLTGLWPTHHGMLFNSSGGESFYHRGRISDDVDVLGRIFRDAGYHTSYFGKSHVGRDDDMQRLGFDEGLPLNYAQAPRRALYPKTDVIQRRWLVDPTIYSGITTADGEDIVEIWYCRRAQEWLRRHASERRNQPFFCVVSTPGPHWPCVVPERYAALYDWREVPLPGNYHDTLAGKPSAHRICRDEAGESGTVTEEEWRKTLARYYALITLIDDAFGETLGVLDEIGEANRTIVVYLSDHGDIMGAHRLFDKGPYMYEETVRIPLILRWPQGMPAGRVVEPFASIIDVFPTLAEAAGLGLPRPIDGRSLWPLIHGHTPDDWPDDAYSQFFGHAPERGLYDVRMLRTARHKLVYYPHDMDELYDEQMDPDELHNVVDEPAYRSLREELQERLLRRMTQAGDPLRIWMKRRARE